MTLQYVAAIIESTYYNGVVRDDDQKMAFEDFLQMARAANGSVMRQLWYEESQQGNPNLYFADSVTTERFKVKRNGRYRVVQLEEGGAVKLPYSMGIMRVAPVMGPMSDDEEQEDDDCGEIFDDNDVFSMGEPGYEYTFGSSDMLDDLGEPFYVPIANTLRLFGFKEADYAEVDYIKNDEDLDIPESAAWQVINMVLGPVLKVVGFPVDVTEDGNPNVVTIKKQLADPQGL